MSGIKTVVAVLEGAVVRGPPEKARREMDYQYDAYGCLTIFDGSGSLVPPNPFRVVRHQGTLRRLRPANNINNFGNVTIHFYDGINRKTREEKILTASGQGYGANIGADLFGEPDVVERSAEGWDSLMMEYSYVYQHKGRKYMLYNGNGFGETGFGYAVLDE